MYFLHLQILYPRKRSLRMHSSRSFAGNTHTHSLSLSLSASADRLSDGCSFCTSASLLPHQPACLPVPSPSQQYYLNDSEGIKSTLSLVHLNFAKVARLHRREQRESASHRIARTPSLPPSFPPSPYLPLLLLLLLLLFANSSHDKEAGTRRPRHPSPAVVDASSGDFFSSSRVGR